MKSYLITGVLHNVQLRTPKHLQKKQPINKKELLLTLYFIFVIAWFGYGILK
jgi:hypothetical protein